MKKFNISRALLGIIAVLMILSAVSINTVYAQSNARESSASNAPVQYSAEELESLRSKLIELLDAVQDFSGTIIPDDAHSAERLAAARKQLEQFTLKDLNALRASIDPAKMNTDLGQARATLNEFKPQFEAYNNKRARNSAGRWSKESNGIAADAPLPQIEGPDAVCQVLVGSGRPSSAVVIAADAVYFAAKVLDIALNRGCNQVLVAGAVILGEGVIAGANTSVACIASDGILFAAEQVRNKVASCDNDFTKRSVDVAVKRMETIHSDLEESVENDNTNKDTIILNDNKNTTTITGAISTGTTIVKGAIDSGTAQIITNDNNNKVTIITNDNNNRTAIIANADANKDTIVANDNKNKDTIVTNDNANRNLIVADAKANKDFLLRTQIEADLSSTDGSTFVALFLTPGNVCAPVLNDKGVAQSGATQCGYLDFARAIVVQTIANLAGANTAQANSFLAQGDSYKAAGNYRQAYQNYRLAYKTAAGISTK